MSNVIQPFPVSASEAVLLGRALEEYLQAYEYHVLWKILYRGDRDGVWFLHFLWSRLGPFHPIMEQPHTENIKNADLPCDIEWDVPAKPVMRFGFSASFSDAFFIECTEPPMLLRITRGHTRRSLPQLVAEHVAPYVARNAGDDVRFSLTLDAPWGKVQQKGMPYHFKWESRRSRRGADNPEKITESIEQLVGGFGEFFAAGRKIGHVLAECQRFEEGFREILDEAATGNIESDIDEDSEAKLLGDIRRMIESAPEPEGLLPEDEEIMPAQLHYLRKRELEKQRRRRHEEDDDGFHSVDGIEWRDSIKEPLEELLQDPFVGGSSSNAAALLEAGMGTLEEWYDPGDWPTEFRKLTSVRAAVWLALGEILHAARLSDGSQKCERDRPRMPRMLKMPLTSRSSNDAIRAQLELCERLYHDEKSFVLPKQMVASLVFGVEALSRRMWPDRFESQGSNTNVMGVLSERLKGSDREKRFASLALNLYGNYRNATSHHFDGFDCSWLEAVIFFYGMRQLLEWSDQPLQGT